jgi:hypothetical protein
VTCSDPPLVCQVNTNSHPCWLTRRCSHSSFARCYGQSGCGGVNVRRSSNMTCVGCSIRDNTPNDLVNYGTSFYILPAPLGHYVEGAVRCVRRMCCPAGQHCDQVSDLLVCPIQNCPMPYQDGRFAAMLASDPLHGSTINSLPSACPAGVYGNHTGNQTSALCSGECPAGFTCPRPGTINPLPVTPGHFSARGSSSSKICPSGYYCAANASTPAMCPAGQRGDIEGSNSTDCGGICPRGAYCKEGAVAPVSCRDGTFGDRPGLRHASECARCPPVPNIATDYRGVPRGSGRLASQRTAG